MGLAGESYFTFPGVLEATGFLMPGLWLLRRGWLLPGMQLQGMLCSQRCTWPPVITCQPPGLSTRAMLDLIKGLFQLESWPKA